MASFQFYQ